MTLDAGSLIATRIVITRPVKLAPLAKEATGTLAAELVVILDFTHPTVLAQRFRFRARIVALTTVTMVTSRADTLVRVILVGALAVVEAYPALVRVTRDFFVAEFTLKPVRTNAFEFRFRVVHTFGSVFAWVDATRIVIFAV